MTSLDPSWLRLHGDFRKNLAGLAMKLQQEALAHALTTSSHSNSSEAAAGGSPAGDGRRTELRPDDATASQAQVDPVWREWKGQGRPSSYVMQRFGDAVRQLDELVRASDTDQYGVVTAQARPGDEEVRQAVEELQAVPKRASQDLLRYEELSVVEDVTRSAQAQARELEAVRVELDSAVAMRQVMAERLKVMQARVAGFQQREREYVEERKRLVREVRLLRMYQARQVRSEAEYEEDFHRNLSHLHDNVDDLLTARELLEQQLRDAHCALESQDVDMQRLRAEVQVEGDENELLAAQVERLKAELIEALAYQDELVQQRDGAVQREARLTQRVRAAARMVHHADTESKVDVESLSPEDCLHAITEEHARVYNVSEVRRKGIQVLRHQVDQLSAEKDTLERELRGKKGKGRKGKKKKKKKEQQKRGPAVLFEGVVQYEGARVYAAVAAGEEESWQYEFWEVQEEVEARPGGQGDCVATLGTREIDELTSMFRTVVPDEQELPPAHLAKASLVFFKVGRSEEERLEMRYEADPSVLQLQ